MVKKMEIITSRNNPKIQFAVSLRDKKARKEAELFYFEGKKLFLEAVAKSVPLISVFYTEENRALVENSNIANNVNLFVTSDSVYAKLTEEKAPEGIFCLAKAIDKYHNFATIYIPDKKTSPKNPSRMLLCSVRDPGNLGTVIRSAAAFGCQELILSNDCADLYNSKTVRASMGMLFTQRITIVENPIETVKALRASGQTVLAAALHQNSLSLFEVANASETCFVIGNEGHGLSEEMIHACSGSVIIPMMDGTESLNASIAASILLYEQFRDL